VEAIPCLPHPFLVLLNPRQSIKGLLIQELHVQATFPYNMQAIQHVEELLISCTKRPRTIHATKQKPTSQLPYFSMKNLALSDVGKNILQRKGLKQHRQRSKT
jgi:hypothetical protein